MQLVSPDDLWWAWCSSTLFFQQLVALSPVFIFDTSLLTRKTRNLLRTSNPKPKPEIAAAIFWDWCFVLNSGQIARKADHIEPLQSYFKKSVFNLRYLNCYKRRLLKAFRTTRAKPRYFCRLAPCHYKAASNSSMTSPIATEDQEGFQSCVVTSISNMRRQPRPWTLV